MNSSPAPLPPLPEDEAQRVLCIVGHAEGHPQPEKFLPEILRDGGEAVGAEHAVVLRVFDL